MDFNNSDFIKAAKEALNKSFGFKTEIDVESRLAKDEQKDEPKKETIDIQNTWVWVEGYKGTDKDMRCNDYQYEIGKLEQMPREEVDECKAGFHLCLKLKDVFNYYGVAHGNRFFKVRALVRLRDKNDYGKMPEYDSNDFYQMAFGRKPRNKLVAAEIEFLEELTIDEILEGSGAEKWPENYKKMAIDVGIDGAKNVMRIETLETYGYSLPFAQYLVNHKKYDVAKAVGSQPDLSMDMKVLYIMQG